MKTKLSSFDQIFTVMHTVPLFCHIVNLSVQYTHTATFYNFEQRHFLFIRRFNWKWNTSATPLIYLLVILEYVLISLMPHSELCRRDQIPTAALRIEQIGIKCQCAKAGDTFPILAAMTDSLWLWHPLSRHIFLRTVENLTQNGLLCRTRWVSTFGKQ